MSDGSTALAVRQSRGVARRLFGALLDWEPTGERTPLLRSQQHGVVPTMAFWLRSDVRHVLLPTYLAGLASTMLLATAVGASPLVGAMMGATLPLLAVGVLERYVRREASRRVSRALTVPSNR